MIIIEGVYLGKFWEFGEEEVPVLSQWELEYSDWNVA